MQSSGDLNTFYWIMGVMIFMNLGTIVTVVGAGIRGIWWLSKLDSRVERNRYDINGAHDKIRTLTEARK